MQTLVLEKTLIEGVWFAMEQAGRLLNTAVRVYEASDHGSAVALAMFAHEELGRSRILLDLADEVHRGETVNAKSVRERCNDHLEKQRRGAFSVVHQPKQGEPLAAALMTQMNNRPGTPEYEAARAEIDAATVVVWESQPQQRHYDRMAAVYLDLANDGQTWIKPRDVDRQMAYEKVVHAVNDYSVGSQWFVEPLLSVDDKTLLSLDPKKSLIRTGRPSGLTLPMPTWPSLPGSGIA